MKKVLLLVFIFSIGCFGQEIYEIKSEQSALLKKTDAERAGLKGKVNSVSEHDGLRYDHYDRQGHLILERSELGCSYEKNFTIINPEKRALKIRLEDMTNSATCFREREKERAYLQIPRTINRDAKGVPTIQLNDGISYEMSYSTLRFKLPNESRGWILDETAKVGKLFAWRTKYFYDDKFRLTQELTANYDLTVSSKVYVYDGADPNPVSAEVYWGNQLVHKTLYKYEEFDKEGNWTKMIVTFIIPKPYGDNRAAILRKITYYEN